MKVARYLEWMRIGDAAEGQMFGKKNTRRNQRGILGGYVVDLAQSPGYPVAVLQLSVTLGIYAVHLPLNCQPSVGYQATCVVNEGRPRGLNNTGENFKTVIR